METVETVIGKSMQICGIIWAGMMVILLLFFLFREASNYIVRKEKGMDQFMKVMTNIGGYAFYGFIALICIYAIIAGIESIL